MQELTPRQIVAELDRHIVGQNDAKRAVAIAIRNRWRRQQLDDEMRNEVAPKNILMIGPTGVGKTEIARRLATLTGAPFIKVEATKYTEVGYYGRDVESMVRELVENAIGLVREKELERVEDGGQAPRRRAAARSARPAADAASTSASTRRTRPSATNAPAKRCGPCSLGGELENRKVEITIEQKAHAMMIPGMGPGGDSMDFDFQGMFEKILPKNVSRRQMTVAEARRVLFEQESRGADQPGKGQRPGDRAGRERRHHLRRRDGQGRRQRRRPRGRRLAARRAARPVADRRRHGRQHPLRLRADRPRPVHRRRRVPQSEAVAT